VWVGVGGWVSVCVCGWVGGWGGVLWWSWVDVLFAVVRRIDDRTFLDLSSPLLAGGLTETQMHRQLLSALGETAVRLHSHFIPALGACLCPLLCSAPGGGEGCAEGRGWAGGGGDGVGGGGVAVPRGGGFCGSGCMQSTVQVLQLL
jgi:hypothetical protein